MKEEFEGVEEVDGVRGVLGPRSQRAVRTSKRGCYDEQRFVPATFQVSI